MSKKSKRLSKWIVGGMGVLVAATAASTGKCADTPDALLDTLVKKGILTEQEAQDIKAENTTNITSMAASKWRISDSIKSIGLYGDVRFRYEYRGVDEPKGAGLTKDNTYYMERFRYAFRAGIRGDLYDDWSYGVRLETSTNPRSSWVTFGKNTTAGSVTPGDKAQGAIGVGQIFLNWHPESWYEMTAGQMPMPLYTTTMLWSSSLNPEGAFEKLKYSSGPVDFFADFGQFMYQDTSPDVSLPSSSTFLLAWQAGLNVKLPNDMSFKVAPVLYTYAGRGTVSSGLDGIYTGQGSAGLNPGVPGGLAYPNAYNEVGLDYLRVVEVPMELNFVVRAFGTNYARLFGDFAYNTQGIERARAAAKEAGFKHAYTDDITAYQVGIGIGNGKAFYGPMQGLVFGSTSKKNTWEARFYWQHIEQYALDANLMDSDFFEGRCNLQGVYSALSYSFTDAIIGTVRYGYGYRINNNLGTGGSNLDIPGINPINDYNIVQLDLTWRF
jgi:hypothetical protein